MKHRLSLEVAWLKVLSKFLTRLLQRSIQAFDRSITHRVAIGTNPALPCAAFSAFVGLGASWNLILVITIGIDGLQGNGELVWVIAMVEQNGDFWDVDGFSSKVVEIVAHHFN